MGNATVRSSAGHGGPPTTRYLLAISRKFATRAGWGLADQALSSLTNFGLGIVVARSVSTSDFGAFSLGFAAYLIIMGITRAVAAQPLVIRYSTVTVNEWRAAVRRSTGAAYLIGILAGLVCLTIGVLSDGAFGQAFTGLGLTLPGLMVQDTFRSAFFARGVSRLAFFNDLVWAVLMFVPLLVMMVDGRASVLTATLVWGLSATGAAVYGVRQADAGPHPLQARGWVREHRDVVPHYLGEFGATAGASQLGLFGIGGIASLATVGALRAADIALGPLRTFFSGVRQVAQPETVRLLARGRNLVRACAALSAALAVIALVAGTALRLMPDEIGVFFLDDTWFDAQPVILPLTISVMAAGVLVGAQMGLHALVAVGRSLTSRILLSIMLVSFKLIGAAMGGAVGAATGGAVAMWIGASLWWWQFVAANREYRSADPAPDLVRS